MKFVNQDYRTARLAGGLSSALVAAIRTGDAFSNDVERVHTDIDTDHGDCRIELM
jgi:hypothetical protein